MYFWIQINQNGEPKVTKIFPSINTMARMVEIGMSATEHTKNMITANHR